mgnify:CR=1 FL=1
MDKLEALTIQEATFHEVHGQSRWSRFWHGLNHLFSEENNLSSRNKCLLGSLLAVATTLLTAYCAGNVHFAIKAHEQSVADEADGIYPSIDGHLSEWTFLALFTMASSFAAAMRVYNIFDNMFHPYTQGLFLSRPHQRASSLDSM